MASGKTSLIWPARMVSIKYDDFVTTGALLRMGPEIAERALLLMQEAKSGILPAHVHYCFRGRRNMGYYTILESTNLLIARYGWTLRRCRRRFDDDPLRFILLDNAGAVIKNTKVDRQRRQGFDLGEILTLLAYQKNAELAGAAARLFGKLGDKTDDVPQ